MAFEIHWQIPKGLRVLNRMDSINWVNQNDETLWWNKNTNKWEEYDVNGKDWKSSSKRIRSYKAMLRHLRKHTELHVEGTNLLIFSRHSYYHYDNYAKCIFKESLKENVEFFPDED